MNIAICDDNITHRDAVINNIQQNNPTDATLTISQFENAEALLQAYRKGNRYDLIFLDVEMGKVNGIDAAMEIRKCQPNVLLVFISSHPQYAIPAYDCQPLYFITKPINSARFSQIFAKVMERYKQLHQYYVIQNKGQIIKLLIEEITYVEVFRKHIIFHTAKETYETTGTTLQKTVESLLPYGFCQVHQSILVNMEHIKAIEQYDIILDDDTTVPISVRKKSQVLKTFAEYIERTM